MCDTLCVLRPEGTLFAKNSDRQPTEVQLIESHPAREAGGTLRTTHIEIPDDGAFALMGARPEWMWGMEHGVNEHRVAIGNEKVWTVLDPSKETPALTGMDLVRLGLERGRTADEALDVMTSLLAEHGQGGICDQITGEAYFSSFIIADPRAAWVLETSGRSWVASPVEDHAAISNRLTLGTEWTRSSPDIAPGTDWDTFRHPRAPTGHADARLGASRACLVSGARTPAQLAAHLRDHGSGPWGDPTSGDAIASPLPATFDPVTGEGVTVCMHLRSVQNTTSSIVAELPSDPGQPLRAWVALGQPCVTPFVPVWPPAAVPSALSRAEVWHRFEALRSRVEADGAALSAIRGVFGPLERELWAEADVVGDDVGGQRESVAAAWRRVEKALAAAE